MKSITWRVLVFFIFFISKVASARTPEHEMEQERLSGYRDQVIESQIYDRERLRSYRAFLEGLEKEIFDKRKTLRDYKKAQKKEKNESEDVAEYNDYLKTRKSEDRVYEAAREEFVKNQKKGKAIASRRSFSEEEELGIFVERPRYDYKKRAMYGGKPKYKIAISTGGSGSGSTSTYPPPDFVNDSGYIPPPPPPPPAVDFPMNEPFYDEIPPPPPPPMPGDFGNPEMGDGYIPPPPPPPPMFDGEF